MVSSLKAENCMSTPMEAAEEMAEAEVEVEAGFPTETQDLRIMSLDLKEATEIETETPLATETEVLLGEGSLCCLGTNKHRP